MSSLPVHQYDVIVIGGGAAGLMCAIEAGKREKRVAVLDHADHIGKKILISGGGRCNFTNLHCRPENFLSANPHFAKSALARYTPQDFVALVEKHQIPYHEKTLGQLFCDRTARDILDMLMHECRRSHVQILSRIKVTEVVRADGFTVRTAAAEFHAPALVIATGGLSISKMGATPFGYEIARQFGLKIKDTRPALVPLTLNAADRKSYCDLTGVATEVIASIDGQQFREKLLITHRGLSGPAILQISSYWKKPQAITLDIAPGARFVTSLLDGSAPRDLTAVKTAFRAALPQRLADRWVELNAPKRWNNPALEELDRTAHAWQVFPDGTEGYDKAEVTSGGVDTDELSAKTMESRKVPGLYFIGEVVDVTGHLGGFNFQWAWASGFASGQAV